MKWVVKFGVAIALTASAISISVLTDQSNQSEFDVFWEYAQSQISVPLDDFVYLGDDYFARFISDEREKNFPCEIFDTCLHVELVTLDSCSISGELEVNLLI